MKRTKIFMYLKLFLALTHKGYHPKEDMGQLQLPQGSMVLGSKSVQISNRVRRINHS